MKDPVGLLLIGAGNMGGALLAALAEAGALDPARSAIVDPSPGAQALAVAAHAGFAVNPPAETAAPDVCLIAVKPQQVPVVVPALSWPQMSRTLFISIAAGTSLSTLRQLLPQPSDAGRSDDVRLVRAMPNLPVAAGAGLTLLTAAPTLSAGDHALATSLFATAGATSWVQSEDALDRMMAITACGPGFVFAFTEALAAAAEALGADAPTASFYAAECLIGAAALLRADGRTPADLRAAVTSPGGTTAAGLAVLNTVPDLRTRISEAASAAYARAVALRA